jgi:hypothetical protein
MKRKKGKRTAKKLLFGDAATLIEFNSHPQLFSRPTLVKGFHI